MHRARLGRAIAASFVSVLAAGPATGQTVEMASRGWTSTYWDCAIRMKCGHIVQPGPTAALLAQDWRVSTYLRVFGFVGQASLALPGRSGLFDLFPEVRPDLPSPPGTPNPGAPAYPPDIPIPDNPGGPGNRNPGGPGNGNPGGPGIGNPGRPGKGNPGYPGGPGNGNLGNGSPGGGNPGGGNPGMVTPEPASLLLMATGLGGLGMSALRKRRRRKMSEADL